MEVDGDHFNFVDGRETVGEEGERVDERNGGERFGEVGGGRAGGGGVLVVRGHGASSVREWWFRYKMCCGGDEVLEEKQEWFELEPRKNSSSQPQSNRFEKVRVR